MNVSTFRLKLPFFVLALVITFLFRAPEVHAQDPPPLWEEIYLQGLTSIQYGGGAWGDVDGDGDLDLAYFGNSMDFGSPKPITRIYMNEGEVARSIPDPPNEPRFVYGIDYQALPTRDFVVSPVWRGALAWGDANGDGRIDLALSGLTESGDAELQIFLSSPDSLAFTLAFTLPGLSDGDLLWADLDNDGDQDLVLSGYDAGDVPRTFIYENTRSPSQSLNFVSSSHTIIGVGQSKMAVGDVDSDRDLDLIVTGIADPQEFVTRLYRNDGSGNFTTSADIFKPLYGAAVNWGDYDNDGDMDLVYSGGEINAFYLRGEIFVYENNNGSFSPDGVSFIGSFVGDPAFGRYRGSAHWGDYNNDGYLDFLIAGSKAPQQSPAGQVYENRRNNLFTHTTVGFFGGSFPGGLYGTSFWGDYDNDGDLDILSIGDDENRGNVALALRNYLPFYPRNAIPSPPVSTSAVTAGSSVTLSWSPGQDSNTPTAGLTYNVRMGSTSGGNDVVSAMARESDGHRYVAAIGNAQNNLGWKITGLEPGTYYWAVQTIDTSYKGSPFTVENTFTITP